MYHRLTCPQGHTHQLVLDTLRDGSLRATLHSHGGRQVDLGDVECVEEAEYRALRFLAIA